MSLPEPVQHTIWQNVMSDPLVLSSGQSLVNCTFRLTTTLGRVLFLEKWHPFVLVDGNNITISGCVFTARVLHDNCMIEFKES